MKLSSSVLIAVLFLGGCRTGDDTTAEAASFVVQDLLPRAPANHRPYLSGAWAVHQDEPFSPLPEDLLQRLLAESGLPLADSAMVTGRTPGITILYIYEPEVIRPDSVFVWAGWTAQTGGDGGAGWGEDFFYDLDCSEECRLLGQPGTAHWN